MQAAQSNDCPLNSTRPSSDALCVCDEDYAIAGVECLPEDNAGGAGEPPPSNECPENSVRPSPDALCVCNEGYEIAGAACLEELPACPDNSARPSPGMLCVCNEGYEIAGAACLEKLSECPQNSARPSRTEDCACNSGYERAGADCLAILPRCPDNSARLLSRGICVCNENYEAAGAACVLKDAGGQPPSNACPDNSARPSPGMLCICDDGYEIAGAACLPMLSACPDNSARPSRTEDCACSSGYEKVGEDCLAILSPCPDNSARPVPRGICVCDSGYVPDGAACMRIACPDNSARATPDADCECNMGYDEVGGACLEMLAACPMNSARPTPREDCECNMGYDEVGAECLEMLDACPENSSRDSPRADCVCNEFYEDNGDGCRLPSDTAEYQSNPFLDEINPLYAYTKGHHGAGVTIAMVENNFNGCFAHTHEDLAGQLISVEIIPPGATEPDETDSRFEGCIRYNASRGAGTAAAKRNETGGHGVAPEAKVVPLHWRAFNNYSNWTDDQTPVIDNDISIVNIAYGTIPKGGHFVEHATFDDFYSFAKTIAVEIEDNDIVYVWMAGESGYNGIGQPDSEIQPNLEAHAPLINRALEDNWLVAVAVERDSEGVYRIESRSNGCGDTRSYCLAAPAGVAMQPDGPDDEYFSSTFPVNASFYVSGAMALLKSAAPAVSVTALRAVLLATATDIGNAGTDDLYGRGLINVSAAIRRIETMETAGTDNLPGIKLHDFQTGLPDGFRHLPAGMKNISVAVEITENAFMNIPLSDLLPQGENAAPALGGAADEMFAAREKEKRNQGFFAFADSSLGAYKLSWQSGAGKTQLGGEISHFAEDGTFAGLGALGAADAKQHGGKIRVKRGFSAGISAFGEYEYAEIKANAESGKFISDIRGAKKDGWTAGLEYANIFRHADRLQLKARQQERFSGGELVIQHPQASGNFHESFIGEETQEIVLRESQIALREKRSLTWSLGYAAKSAKSEWAIAAEYNEKSNNGALSAKWRIDF